MIALLLIVLRLSLSQPATGVLCEPEECGSGVNQDQPEQKPGSYG